MSNIRPQGTLLDDLKDWLKKAKKEVDNSRDPKTELTRARQAATDAIHILNIAIGTPEPGEPQDRPSWQAADPDETIGACLALADTAQHYYGNASRIEQVRETLVVCRWAVARSLTAIHAGDDHDDGGGWPPPPPGDPGTADTLLDQLKKFLEKAKKKVGENGDPTTDLVDASNQAQDVINELSDRIGNGAPAPPTHPLSAGSASQYMMITMALFQATEAEYDIGDEVGTRQSCVDCKWAIDSFIAWLAYYDRSKAKLP